MHGSNMRQSTVLVMLRMVHLYLWSIKTTLVICYLAKIVVYQYRLFVPHGL